MTNDNSTKHPTEAMLSIAFGYAARGWAVLPLHTPTPAGCSCGKQDCSAAGKHPRLRNGVHGASSDPDKLREWWTKWPTANVGIAVGRVSGLIIVDLDSEGARQAWDARLVQYGRVRTPSVRSGRAGGGRHVYFAYPEGMTIRSRGQGAWAQETFGSADIDVLSDGKLVVAAGSLHSSGALYAWEGLESVPDVLPEWLLAALTASDKTATEVPEWHGAFEAGRDYSGYVSAVARSVHSELASVAVGGRNNALNKAAFRLGQMHWTGAITRGEARALVFDAARLNGSLKADGQGQCHKTFMGGWEAGQKVPAIIESRHKTSGPDDVHLKRRDVMPDTQPDEEAHNPKRDEPLEKPKWKTPKERALAIGYSGIRIPLGIPTLDAAMRGGLVPGQGFVIFGGAPSAGKTTFVVQIARGLHEAGHALAIVAADESGDGLMARWGQMGGLHRSDIERGAEWAREGFAKQVDSERFIFVDQNDEPAETDPSLEHVCEELVKLAEPTQLPPVLIVDSIQTVMSHAAASADSPRERVDAVIKTLKGIARKHKAIIVITSEMARGFYRGGGAPGTEAMASFKESGSIEYQGDVLIAITSPQDDPTRVDLTVPKSRPGGKGTCITLRLDVNTARLAEENNASDDNSNGDIADEIEERRAIEVEKAIKATLLALVRAKGDVTTRSDLERITGRRTRATVEAVSSLLRDGKLNGGRGSPYKVVGEGAQGGENDVGRSGENE